jgi:NAD(P)-dependent dehydrogenase (short-subunit alcohol dehydrogenase family)
MDLRLNGQTAVVTGASHGIGLAVTRGLVAEGVHVTAGALKSSAELDELAGAGQVRVVEVDLAEPGGPARLVAAAGDRIDILVNNVGAAPARPGGFGGITDEDWQASLTLNLMAAVRATRAALPVMLAAGKGAIVTISSANAFLPDPRKSHRPKITKGQVRCLTNLIPCYSSMASGCTRAPGGHGSPCSSSLAIASCRRVGPAIKRPSNWRGPIRTRSLTRESTT